MGKGIVYCQDRGKSLRDDAFDSGKAHTIDDRPYCIQCRAPQAAPAKAPSSVSLKKISNSRLPKATGPVAKRPTPPPLPATPPSRKPVLIGAAAGAAAILVLLLVLALPGAGKREDPSDIEPKPVPAAGPPAELLELEKLASESLDPKDLAGRCERLRPALKGTPHAARLEILEKKVKEARAAAEKEAVAKVDRFVAQIREKIKEDTGFKQRGEIESMLATAERTAGARTGEVATLKAGYQKGYRDAAQAAAQKLRQAAEPLEKEGRYGEAADVLAAYPEAFLRSNAGEELARYHAALVRKHEESEKLARVTHEGEALKVLSADGTTQAQDLKHFGKEWSQGNHLWWRDAKPKGVLRLEFESRVAGRRTLALSLTGGPDYGIVQVSVNGKVLAASIDLWSEKVVHRAEDLFEVDLKKGPNELKVEITGCNAKATPPKHLFGLDYLRIE